MINILGLKFYWHYLICGITLGPVLSFLEKYIFADWQFAIWIALLIGLDTFTGVWKAFKLKKVSSRGWGQVITKIIVYGIFLIVIHALQNFTIGKDVNGIYGWVDNLAFATLMTKEAVSIFENLSVIAPKFFPTKWLEKLKDFQDKKTEKTFNENLNK